MIDINLEHVNYLANASLSNNITTIFQRMDKFNDQITAADVYIKVNVQDPEHTNEIGVKVFLPGENIFISKTGPSFESAAHDAYDSLKNVLTKRKETLKENHQPQPHKPA